MFRTFPFFSAFYLVVFFSFFLKIQEYSEDSNSEPNVDLENQYYNSKALKEDDPKAALSSFQKVFCLFILSLIFILIHI